MTPKSPAVIALLVAAMLALAGCSAGGAGVRDLPVGIDEDTAAEADGAVQPGAAVIVKGSVEITVDDPIAAAQRATRIVADAGGHVDARSESSPSGSAGWATLTLRVPADALEDVRTALAELGHVDGSEFSTASVGGEQRDLDARISTLSASIGRYDEWLGAASSTDDLIRLEDAITERRTELERLEGEQRALADQVSMSTITLTLTTVPVVVTHAPQNIGDAIVMGWQGFATFWAGAAIVLGLGLPWLLLIGLIAGAVVWLVIRSNRRSRAEVLAPFPTAFPPAPPTPAPPQ